MKKEYYKSQKEPYRPIKFSYLVSVMRPKTQMVGLFSINTVSVEIDLGKWWINKGKYKQKTMNK